MGRTKTVRARAPTKAESLSAKMFDKFQIILTNPMVGLRSEEAEKEHEDELGRILRNYFLTFP